MKNISNQINILAAFFAGILSFLSPCVIPLVPGYISFVSGLSLDELTKSADPKAAMKKAGLGSVLFVLGFSVVFVMMGASASAIGNFLRDHLNVISKFAGVVIILFGLHTSGILPIRWLYYQKNIETSRLAPGFIGSFLMGLAFAFGWTPCIGPILAGILALAATEGTIARGVFLLSVYSLGLGIPFILTGFFVNKFLQFFARYKRFVRWGEILSGILLIAVGGLIFSNKLSSLLNHVPSFFLKFAL